MGIDVVTKATPEGSPLLFELKIFEWRCPSLQVELVVLQIGSEFRVLEVFTKVVSCQIISSEVGVKL